MYFEKRESKKAKKGYTWSVLFYYSDPETGLRKRYKKSGFETKADAQKHGQEAQNMLMQGVNPKIDKTLADVFNEWLELNSERLAPRSIEQYNLAWKRLKAIHFIPIKKLQYGKLQQTLNDLDLSKKVKQVEKALLLNLFKFAIKSGYTGNNPAQYLEVNGREQKPDEPPLELEEIQAIASQIIAKSDFRRSAYEVFLWIGYYAGLRASEILALEWSDIDMDLNQIRVNKQLNRDGVVTSRLKTKGSNSIIPLCAPLKDILIQWNEENSNDLIICDSIGDPISYNQVNVILNKAGKRAGINFHTHRLRHTYITNLVRSGADPKTAAQLARHSDVATTMNIYTQMQADDLSKAVNRAYPESPEKAPKLNGWQA